MKKLFFGLFLALLGISSRAQQIDLSGTWRFATDRHEVGVSQEWFLKELGDQVQLPGSMMSNDKGDAVNLQTPWVGGINDKSFFTHERFAPYRKADNFKIPCWLQPNKYYAGIAWYQRQVEVPTEWKNQSISLFLERCHWQTRVWIDGVEVGMSNALGAPHQYDLSAHLKPGKHLLSIQVDNKVRAIDPGENSHSISDHTQGNWNGIVGAIYLEAKPKVYYELIELHPAIKERKLGLKIQINNTESRKKRVELSFELEGKKHIQQQVIEPGIQELQIELPLPQTIKPWDEFHPNLYTLHCGLQAQGAKRQVEKVSFGCRDWSVEKGVIHLNGHPVFMRGTLDCASFPITGYPPTDKESWLRQFRTCKAHGVNHIRFHSWCPPKAAFEAADELGLYLQAECSSWPNSSTTIGDGKPIDQFLMQEAQAILKAFGNHPSFSMMALGNEPGGKHQKSYLTDFVSHWKAADARRLYTSTAGWPNLPVNDFLNDPTPRVQGWGQGLRSIINGKTPSTAYDWSNYTSKATQPFISHEIGQWCVYPNFNEIQKYTGVYQAKNFEIFQESLAKNGLTALADSFLIASGMLQTLCYKADIEAALRTKNFGGFQLLGLNDFPGQGTALVGTLDAFWQEKGYVSPEAYRRFCNSIVPLARMERLIYENNETFVAQVEVANYQEVLTNPAVRWVVRDGEQRIIKQGTFATKQIAIGNCQPLGTIQFALEPISRASQLNLEVSVDGYSNDWNIWVYPAQKATATAPNILLADSLDKVAIDRLAAGGKVLLSIKKGSLSKAFGGDIAIGFSSIFWNTSWTANQPPHTLGILCNPTHSALAEFPTQSHSDYQWWDAMSHSGAIHIGALPQKVEPIVRVIDDWFTNRSLALVFEVKVGKGKLLVSSIDLHQEMASRPAGKQMLHSLMRYMSSEAFAPTVAMEAATIDQLIQKI